MKLRSLRLIAVLILITQSISAQGDVDIDSLIEEVCTNKQQNSFSNYSYKMEFVRRKKTLVGMDKLIKRFDVVLPSKMPKNRKYKHRLLLVYDNKKSLTASDILMNRERIINDLEQDENGDSSDAKRDDITNKTGGYLTLRADTSKSHHKSIGIDLLKLIENSQFSDYKEFIANGRNIISLHFSPKKDKSFGDDFFYLNKIEGIVLIDKSDKRIIEVKAYPLGKLEEFHNQKGTHEKNLRVFHYLQTRVQEGYWFPQLVTLNFMQFSNQFDDLKIRIDFIFTDYKRFSASVDNYSPKPINKKAETTPQKQIRKKANPNKRRKNL